MARPVLNQAVKEPIDLHRGADKLMKSVELSRLERHPALERGRMNRCYYLNYSPPGAFTFLPREGDFSRSRRILNTSIHRAWETDREMLLGDFFEALNKALRNTNVE